MSLARRLLPALLIAFPAFAQEAPQPAVPEEGTAQQQAADLKTWSFNEDEVGKLPKEWTPGETNSADTPATWAVANDSTSPDGPNVVAVQQPGNTGQTYNLLLADEPAPANLVVSVLVRADSGEEDQGGGPIWRAKDTQNYYVARWNPLEQNLRVYAVRNGKRKMLAGVDAKADPKAWHEIRVEMVGDRILATLDDKHFVETQDATLTEAGKIGLWTKADAATAFDQVRLANPEP